MAGKIFKKILILIFMTLGMVGYSETSKELSYTYHNLNGGKIFPNIEKYKNNTAVTILSEIPKEIKEGIHSEPGNYLAHLVKYITEWTNDEYLKIKSIHDWICLNIEYDIIGYNKGEIKITDPYVTLRYKNAVCGGYAALFNIMAKTAGFESTIISGYTKGKSKYAIGNQKIFTRHAWNAIKINDIYYLIDVTWNAGYVLKNKYIRNYSTDFFLSDPEFFIRTHYPSAPGWILMDSFISIEEFKLLK